jgi:hypothetical protein
VSNVSSNAQEEIGQLVPRLKWVIEMLIRLRFGVVAILVCVSIVSLSFPHGVEAKEPGRPAIKHDDFGSYCNQKYGYLVQYPQYLKGEGEPDAQDGQLFSSKSKPLQMRVWGCYSNWLSGEDMSIEQQRDQDIKNLASSDLPKPVITYKQSGKNWYVISGTSADKIFYQKTVKGKDVFATVMLTYPTDRKAEFDSDVGKIARSLSIPKLP